MATETYNKSYKEAVELISDDLGYKKGEKFNTLITKQLKLLRENYADEVIIETVKNEGWKIKNKTFDKQIGKILYYFTIIKNNISFYDKKYKENKVFNEKMKLQNKNNFVEEEIFIIASNKKEIKNDRDISSILEEFE